MPVPATPPPTLLRSALIVPIDRSPIRDGAILFSNGKIADIGPASQLIDANPGVELIDLGDCVILPGLVNSHVHLELSNHTVGGPPASFVDWLTDLMGRPTDVASAVQIGMQQSLRSGVTTLGDISRQCAVTRPLLNRGPLRIVSYGEVQAMAERRTLLDERFAIAADISQETEHLRVGITPHAPYSIEPDGYRRCLDFAIENRRPIATHLAETPDEAMFLAHHTGPFRKLWGLLNAWDDDVPPFSGGPIRYAKSLGLLDYPTLLAHVNYCDDAELDILAAGQASVVYCPRTHAYFGHPPHRWREMRARGINVAIGTDSCASSPDLNLLDDLRLLRRIAQDLPATDLLEMATLRSARALGMESQVGSLTPGKAADAIAIPGTDLGDILDRPVLPSAVWIGGKSVAISY